MIVNNQHTCTVEQSTVRLVVCEKCDSDYVYQLTRSGEGYGNSVYFLDEKGAKSRAERKAKEQLARKMTSAVDAIPCPECGHYQEHMIKKARSDRAVLFAVGAGLTGLLAIGLFILGSQTRVGMIGYIIGGVFLLATLIIGVLGMIAYTSYDPNKQPKSQRRAFGQEKATLRDEFEREFAASAEDAFDSFCKKLGKKGKKNKRFEFIFWADRGQLKHSDTIKVRLPVGNRVAIKLSPDMRDGDTFEHPYEIDGYPIEFVCVLNVYSKPKL